jgi:hypothetical protein
LAAGSLNGWLEFLVPLSISSNDPEELCASKSFAIWTFPSRYGRFARALKNSQLTGGETKGI